MTTSNNIPNRIKSILNKGLHTTIPRMPEILFRAVMDHLPLTDKAEILLYDQPGEQHFLCVEHLINGYIDELIKLELTEAMDIAFKEFPKVQDIENTAYFNLCNHYFTEVVARYAHRYLKGEMRQSERRSIEQLYLNNQRAANIFGAVKRIYNQVPDIPLQEIFPLVKEMIKTVE